MKTTIGYFLLTLSFCSTCYASQQGLSLNRESAALTGLEVHMEGEALERKPNRKVLQAKRQDILLVEAIRKGDDVEVERLLNTGADPNYMLESGVAVLGLAAATDNGRIVTLLLSAGADIEGPPGSLTERAGLLQIAAHFDALNSAEALLNAGAPIDKLNLEGFSPLHQAAVRGSVRVATVLLDNEASIERGSKTGAPPLLYAALYGHLFMVRLLLSRGADVNSGNEDGNTPLHEATQENDALIIKELLVSGANIDARASNGATPLYQAAALGNRAAIKILVLNGADKSIEAYNETPKEALCDCVHFSELLDVCSVEECENPRRMLELLM